MDRQFPVLVVWVGVVLMKLLQLGWVGSPVGIALCMQGRTQQQRQEQEQEQILWRWQEAMGWMP
jgi:hypothetical protein